MKWDAFLPLLPESASDEGQREERLRRRREARGGGGGGGGGLISAADMARGERVPVTSFVSGMVDLSFYFFIYESI